jgi:hypothetical protein
MIRALLSLLADWVVGPSCDVCGKRSRGWRTLMQHQWDVHSGDRR